jgi:hypothetical protein
MLPPHPTRAVFSEKFRDASSESKENSKSIMNMRMISSEFAESLQA